MLTLSPYCAPNVKSGILFLFFFWCSELEIQGFCFCCSELWVLYSTHMRVCASLYSLFHIVAMNSWVCIIGANVSVPHTIVTLHCAHDVNHAWFMDHAMG